MNSVQYIALSLLLGRLVAVTFISLVLMRQWRLFKYHIDSGLNGFRKLMFALSIVLFLSNLVPILTDVAGLLQFYAKSTGSPTKLGIAYTYSNMTTSVISAYLIYAIYRIAGKTSIKKDFISHSD